MKKILLFALMLCVVLAVPAFASPVFTAFTAPDSFNSPPDYQPNNPVNLGMVFSANSYISVTGLGFYADPAATASETVTLYNSSGGVVVQTVVPLSGLSNGYFWAPVTLTGLAAGTYTVSAYVGDNPWAYGAAPTTASQITFLNNDYAYAGSPAFPTNTGGSGPAYYGPNLMFTVPEPSFLLMLFAGLASVILMIGASRRKLAL